jgi:hypothetical protein
MRSMINDTDVQAIIYDLDTQNDLLAILKNHLIHLKKKGEPAETISEIEAIQYFVRENFGWRNNSDVTRLVNFADSVRKHMAEIESM